MVPMLVVLAAASANVLAAASADARRFAVIVRGDAFRSHGEKRNQRLKNVLRCTPEAAAMQEALAAQFRAHVVAPLETAGHVDVFLSGAGCAGDAASSRNAGDAHGDGARARATWDAALAVWYGPVAAAELGARGALQTDKVLRGFDLVAGHERAAGVAYDAVLVTRFDASHRAPLAAAGLGDLLAATFVEVHGDWFWSAPRKAVPVLVAQLRGGCAADAGEDPASDSVHLYHCAWAVRDHVHKGTLPALAGLAYGGRGAFERSAGGGVLLLQRVYDEAARARPAPHRRDPRRCREGQGLPDDGCGPSACETLQRDFGGPPCEPAALRDPLCAALARRLDAGEPIPAHYGCDARRELT